MVLTGSADGKAQLWDVATSRRIGPPLTHNGGAWVTGGTFSPDGRTILTGGGEPTSDRGEARVWKVPTPMEGEVERIELSTQLATGLELTASGATRFIDTWTREERWQRLHDLGGTP
jgi:WD40 repeat protein